MVARESVCLSDCELGVVGRVAWRAIARVSNNNDDDDNNDDNKNRNDDSIKIAMIVMMIKIAMILMMILI